MEGSKGKNTSPMKRSTGEGGVNRERTRTISSVKQKSTRVQGGGGTVEGCTKKKKRSNGGRRAGQGRGGSGKKKTKKRRKRNCMTNKKPFKGRET